MRHTSIILLMSMHVVLFTQRSALAFAPGTSCARVLRAGPDGPEFPVRCRPTRYYVTKGRDFNHRSPCVHDLRAVGDNAAVLRFKEASTGAAVVLVGTMHNNPFSSSLAGSVIKQERPRAVLVELCPSRWNATAAAMWTPNVSMRVQLLRWILKDEFQAAFEAARACGLRDVELADQPIAATNTRLRELFFATWADIAAGPSGWNAILRDIRHGSYMLATGDRGFSRALLDPRLIAGAPASIFRAALSTPAVSLYLFATIAIAPATDALQFGTSWSAPVQLLAAVVAMLSSTVVLRVVLIGLITERNSALARAIRGACVQSVTAAPTTQADESASEECASPQEPVPAAPVVAVMGLAHVYGVRRLLQDADAQESRA